MEISTVWQSNYQGKALPSEGHQLWNSFKNQPWRWHVRQKCKNFGRHFIPPPRSSFSSLDWKSQAWKRHKPSPMKEGE